MPITDVHAHILVPDCLEEMRRVASVGIPKLDEDGDRIFLTTAPT